MTLTHHALPRHAFMRPSQPISRSGIHLNPLQPNLSLASPPSTNNPETPRLPQKGAGNPHSRQPQAIDSFMAGTSSPLFFEEHANLQRRGRPHQRLFPPRLHVGQAGSLLLRAHCAIVSRQTHVIEITQRMKTVTSTLTTMRMMTKVTTHLFT